MQWKWLALAGASTMVCVGPAHAGWQVKAQAHGAATPAYFDELGSADGSANQQQASPGANGGVAYSAGNTQIHAFGSAASATTSTSSSTLADLSSASIHYYSTQTNGASNAMYGELDDTLHFALPNPGATYAIPFSYTFDGTVSGGFGMNANTFFLLGFGDASSNQANGAGGPYQPPSFGTNPGTSWQNATISAVGNYGYQVTGDLIVGGANGTDAAFQMRANIGCGFDINTTEICDFGNTQRFQFGALPTGASFTSDSGVFLTASQGAGVPEPATWALMILGLGALGATVRTSRDRGLLGPAALLDPEPSAPGGQ